jgi:predicted phosphodiesterase
MQRLAIIADIHGNVGALEAVLADIAAHAASEIINLGDCVSGPLWPRETFALLQRHEIRSVRGNHDRWLAQSDRAGMGASDAFAFDRLKREEIATLAQLPASLQLGPDILAVHGTAESDVEYLLEDVVEGRLQASDPPRLAEKLGGLKSAVLLCGHSHLPWVVAAGADMLIVNPGSVGCPAYLDPNPPAHRSEAGSPHARYALLEQAATGWRVELIAVPYDWAAASRRAAEHGRPDWARALASGFVEAPEAT